VKLQQTFSFRKMIGRSSDVYLLQMPAKQNENNRKTLKKEASGAKRKRMILFTGVSLN